MEIFVDENQVDDKFIGGRTLEEALRHVQTCICDSSNMVVGLRCDGREISPDVMADTLQKPASSFERLEIFTDSKGRLITDAMGQASVCLTETNEARRRVAELLTEGRTVEAAEALAECLHVWQQIHDAMGKSIEMLRLDIDRTTINGEPLAEVIGRPKDVLMQVKNALQVRDHVLLADIMQYEFEEVINSWHELIAKLRQEAEDLA